VRISHLSHISEPLTVALTVTRGKRAPFVVQPLATDVGEHLADLAAASTLEELQTAWKAAGNAGVAKMRELVKLKDARKAELSKPVDEAHPDFVAEVTE